MREGWEYKGYSWAEVLTIINGKNQSAVQDDNGEYPIYGSGGIMGYANDFLCPENTVVIGRKGNINKPLYVTTKFWNVDTAFGLDANRALLLPKYLYYFCLDYDFERHNKAVTIPSLTKADLLKINMALPSLNHQLEIVSELDQINELIRLKKEQLKDYDDLAQSIFYEMFGDPVENEKGWVVKKLGELSTYISNGNTPKGGSQVYIDSGILFLRSQNVWKNRIDLEDVAYIDIETHTKMHRSSLHKNDILITKTGRINTENSSLGRAALFTGEDDSANINGHVYLVRLKDEIPPKYVLYILISNSYRDLIRKTCVGGIDKRQLNRNHIEDFPIIYPPIELQKEYVSRISQVERQKAEVSNAIADLETLLASRMQYWFE